MGPHALSCINQTTHITHTSMQTEPETDCPLQELLLYQFNLFLKRRPREANRDILHPQPY